METSNYTEERWVKWGSRVKHGIGVVGDTGIDW